MSHRLKIAALLLVVFAVPAHADDVPHLRAQGDAVQLIVDGEQFLMLAGELGNSTASDLHYLSAHWDQLVALNLNTVLAPVYWELIEPEEGHFDFSLVDGLIDQARAQDMRLVLLWFGSWKNSMSSYVPSWVKTDQGRFPRARLADGKAVEILSPFHSANRDADARAFAALMRFLRKKDGQRYTVLLVQVENEIGMIPDARDHSAAANRQFDGEVPEALLEYLDRHREILAAPLQERWAARGNRTQGSWEDVFGAGKTTDELFMAWHFGTYVEAIAAAGLAEYDLPLFINAALVRPGKVPGEYPSAGPLPQVFDIWRAAAPSIDFFAPDIYFPNFVEWARAYDVPNMAYFIPETGRQPMATPANALYAFGEHDAMGFSPFAIELYDADDALGDAYALIAQLKPLIVSHQGRGTMHGVRPVVSFDGVVDDDPVDVQIGGYTLNVSFVAPFEPRDQQVTEAHGGLIISLGPDEFLVAGKGLTVTFHDPEQLVGIDRIDEGRMVDGEWVPGRRMNGDESHQGRHLRLPTNQFSMQRVRLYKYQ